jgi:hypothetical protein
MKAVPLDIQRRLEKRWASRFTTPASNTPKDVGTKSTTPKPTGPPHNAATTKEDPPARTGGVGDR